MNHWITFGAGPHGSIHSLSKIGQCANFFDIKGKIQLSICFILFDKWWWKGFLDLKFAGFLLLFHFWLRSILCSTQELKRFWFLILSDSVVLWLRILSFLLKLSMFNFYKFRYHKLVSYWLTDWLTDWLTGLLTDWLADWLTDWLLSLTFLRHLLIN